MQISRSVLSGTKVAAVLAAGALALTACGGSSTPAASSGSGPQLINSGKAYVDDLSADEIRGHRGTLTEPGKDSPHRNRSVEENLDLFARMNGQPFHVEGPVGQFALGREYTESSDELPFTQR